MPRAASTRRAPSTRPPMRNPSRDRQQAEMKELRELISVLESKRETLIKNRKSRRCAPRKDIAPKRDSTERENEELRRQITQLVRMGEALIRAVAGRASSVDDSMFRAGGRARSLSGILHDDLSGILHDDLGLRFALLREGVEQACRQVDTVVKISTEPCSFSTTTSSRFIDGCVQPVMEAVETTTFPLDLAKCGAALWQAARRALWSDYAHVEIYGDDPEWRMGRVTWSRNAATIQSSVVIRRIEERDRELIVWRAVTTLGACQIQYVEETGYAVLQRVRDASGGDFVAKTNFMEWVPRSQSEISRPVADLASLVVAVTHEDTAGVDEMMENLLIEECLGVDL